MTPSSAIILAHPDSNSFCAAIAAAALGNGTEGKSQLFSLYEMKYQPLLDESELRRNIPADDAISFVRMLPGLTRLVLVFPDWWGAEPAIMKGWLDRTLRPDAAYTRDDSGLHGKGDGTRGLMEACSLEVYVTSDDDSVELTQGYRRRYARTIGEFCGFAGVHTRVFAPVRDSKRSQRDIWLEDVKIRRRGWEENH